MAKICFIQSDFDDKYEKYSTLIYRTAYQYLLNVQTAEDVTQEVFVRLLTSTKKFNDDEHEKAWLLRVTINLCKNHLKMRANGNIVLNDDINLCGYAFENLSDLRIDMSKVIKSLSAEQRAVVYLHYYEGFSIKEISKITKSKENTVKSHLRRARHNLKTIIEGE